jgi:hypothetical protein
MTTTVCIAAEDTFWYPHGGGRHWIFLNWLLGLRALGCRVIWMEEVWPDIEREELADRFAQLRERLEPYGVAEIALAGNPDPAAFEGLSGWIPVEEAAGSADLLLNFDDDFNEAQLAHFVRTAFVDRDPGLRQVWMAQGGLEIPPHDVYFSIGETVGTPAAGFPDGGVRWHHVPPPVFLGAWPATSADSDAAYTTVTHWWAGTQEDGSGNVVVNDKRAGFMRFAELPGRVDQRLELAVNLGDEDWGEQRYWEARGWIITDAWQVSSTPWDYQAFIQRSRGEFSCAKPIYVHLQTAWVSDRTVCYLASGKPVVIEDTGPSRFLPQAEGVFRVSDPEGAAAALAAVEADYEHHSRAARAVAEQYFDAEAVVASVLERAMP